MWHKGISGSLGAPGHRFDPCPAQCVRDLMLLQLWLRSQMLLESDPCWGG